MTSFDLRVQCPVGYFEDSMYNEYACRSCYDDEFQDGDVDMLECNKPGLTRTTLILAKGYWRTLTHLSNDFGEGPGSLVIKECPIANACPSGDEANQTGNFRCNMAKG